MLFRLLVVTLTCCFVCGSARAEEAQTLSLRKLILAADQQELAKIPDDAGGDSPVYVQNVPVFSGPDVAPAIAPFIGKPITMPQLNQIGGVLRAIANKHDRVVDLIVPSQNIKTGVVRFAVVMARYNQVQFRGNRYFSRKDLEKNLGIKPGDEISLSSLEDAVNWTNSNPFRRVKVLLNSVTTQPGRPDLVVGVEEAWPYRFAASYDDSGPTIIGKNRYTAVAQFGDLWGIDHQATYQFSTTDNINTFQSHSISYTAPLPWRHYLEFNATYGKMKPELGDSPFGSAGESDSASLRYRIPLGRGDRTGELFAGVDFQSSNNNLEFGGTQVSNSQIHVYQAAFGGTIVRKDAKGGWLASTTFNLSPGGIDSRNSDEAYQPLIRDGQLVHVGRFGAKARYATAVVSVQRALTLSHGWEFTSRGFGQLASANLVGNEQLAIGGANTVRGFDTNILAGDDGFVFSNDLMGPVWKTPVKFLRTKNPLQSRITLFYDAGHVFNHQYFLLSDNRGGFVRDDEALRRPLASTGVGLRMNISNNFSLNFDYGWHITKLPYPSDQNGRGHIKIVFAY